MRPVSSSIRPFARVRPRPPAKPPAPPADPPLAPLPSGGALEKASSTITSVVDVRARVKAPWTARAQAIAAHAVESARGLTGKDAAAAILASVLASKEIAGATVSATVRAVDGSFVVQQGTDAPVNPCSNSKLVTSSFALSVLGPKHRFATEILRTVDGLALVGAFDPTLTTDTLISIAKRVKARGIDDVPRLILDDTALEGGNVPAAFGNYGDEDWDYVARPEALSVNKNVLRLTVKPGREGEAATVDVDQSAFLIRSRVTTSKAGEPFKLGCDELDTAGVLERVDGKAVIDVWGTIAADYAKGKALVMKSPAPSESFADRVAYAFAQAGIHVGTVEQGKASGARLFTHESAPFGEILQTSLSTSNAFDHEMFALAAHAFETKKPVTLPDTAKRLEKFLVDNGAVGTMVNASGIGNENRLRSVDLAMLLAKAESSPKLHALIEALARPGVGTLKTRMLDTKAEGRFAGKTGTGDAAAALSGVVGNVVFSILVDDAKGRDGIRAVLDAAAIAFSS